MAEFIDREQIFPNGVFYVNEQDPQTSLDELINRINNLPKAEVVCIGEKQTVINLLEDIDEIDQIEKMVIHAIYETVLCENYPPQFFAKLKDKIKQRFENYKAITNRNKTTDRRG